MIKKTVHKLIRLALSSRFGYWLGRRVVISLSWHLDEISKGMLARLPLEGMVQSGPFQGLRYPKLVASGSALAPKFVGSYEVEIQTALEASLARQPATVVNIGCGEGYYAVGSALRLPLSRVIAYDLDPVAIANCREMARHNGVADRVDVRECCTPKVLRELALTGPLLVLCDCEGAEMELLQPEYFPTATDFLIELHQVTGCAPEQELPKRFAASHQASLIQQTARVAADWPILAALTPLEQELALNEFRAYPMTWLHLQAKENAPK